MMDLLENLMFALIEGGYKTIYSVVGVFIAITVALYIFTIVTDYNHGAVAFMVSVFVTLVVGVFCGAAAIQVARQNIAADNERMRQQQHEMIVEEFGGEENIRETVTLMKEGSGMLSDFLESDNSFDYFMDTAE